MMLEEPKNIGWFSFPSGYLVSTTTTHSHCFVAVRLSVPCDEYLLCLVHKLAQRTFSVVFVGGKQEIVLTQLVVVVTTTSNGGCFV